MSVDISHFITEPLLPPIYWRGAGGSIALWPGIMGPLLHTRRSSLGCTIIVELQTFFLLYRIPRIGGCTHLAPTIRWLWSSHGERRCFLSTAGVWALLLQNWAGACALLLSRVRNLIDEALTGSHTWNTAGPLLLLLIDDDTGAPQGPPGVPFKVAAIPLVILQQSALQLMLQPRIDQQTSGEQCELYLNPLTNHHGWATIVKIDQTKKFFAEKVCST